MGPLNQRMVDRDVPFFFVDCPSFSTVKPYTERPESTIPTTTFDSACFPMQCWESSGHSIGRTFFIATTGRPP